MSGWEEVGEGVYYRRYAPWDVNVGVVRGADGLVVVDTRASHRQAAELRADLARLDPAPVRFVVNTHWHFDHCFGNFLFPEADGFGHEALPGWLASRGEDARAKAIGAEPREEMDEVVITPPRHLVSSTVFLDLGDRAVELVHLGRGHTDHDLVVLVASVAFAGDLVEESGPPAYGDDCFPLDWPGTVQALLERLEDGTVAVVPGHGQAVDRAFAEHQAEALAEVAAILRELHAAGVPADAALTEDRRPWPPEALAHAVHRGYARLDGTA